jgi:uncharacterized protein (DUF1015 family)
LGEFRDDDGVLHRVERVSEPDRVAAICAAVGRNSVLIADGHHRYAISRTYRDEVRAATGRTDTDAEMTMFYVAELVEAQLSIDPIHRVYHGMSAAALAEHLARYFELTPAGAVTADAAAQCIDRASLCLVAPDGSGVWLRPRPAEFVGVRALDGAYLEQALAELTDSPDPAESQPVTVGYQHGVQNVVEMLRAGRADAAVLIRPTSIAEIRRTALEHLLMPPKSTFFTPKLRTGLVIRPLEV